LFAVSVSFIACGLRAGHRGLQFPDEVCALVDVLPAQELLGEQAPPPSPARLSSIRC
jgi:hypothetical protein